MSTAPRDGTFIDLWRRRFELKSPTSREIVEVGERVGNCFWNKSAGPFHDGEWRAILPGGGGLIIEHEHKWEAVAWVPAPPPLSDGPKGQDETADDATRSDSGAKG